MSQTSKDTEPRVLIVSAPVGGGHTVAAQRLAERLRRAGFADEFVVLDDVGSMLHVGSLTATRLIGSTYQRGISALHGAPHWLAYAVVNRYPSISERGFRIAGGRHLRREILAHRPDIVISTFHAVSATLSSVLYNDAIPVISVVPGAGRVNSLWLHGAVSRFVFPEEEGAQFAIEMGVAPTRVSTIPDIFDPDPSDVPTPREARDQLGLGPGLTVLVSFGSVGLARRMSEFIRLLHEARPPVQIVVNPGQNEQLRRAVIANLGDGAIFVEPDASLIPYLAAADVVVGKAGWLTLTEASAIGRPTLIVDHIRGQEDENVRVACATGFARRATPIKAVELIRLWAEDSETLTREFQFASRRHSAATGADAFAQMVRSVAHRTTEIHPPTGSSDALRF